MTTRFSVTGIVLVIGLICALLPPACATLTESQPHVQTAPSLAAAPVQPGKPAWLTPEKEAALVEVRKILREARQAAERLDPEAVVAEWVARGITSPIRKSTAVKDVESSKAMLIGEIERVQFQAGDFSTAATSKQSWHLTVAQIRYGYTKEAVRTAMQKRFSFIPENLIILKMLSDAGDLAGAAEVARAQVAKEPVDPKRRQMQAELLAYLARRQTQAGESISRETLRQAIEATRVNYPAFQYSSWAAIGCAQAVMGDRTTSEESFRQAVRAVGEMKREEYPGQKASALSLVGKAAALSGLRTISQQSFKEAIRVAETIPESRARGVAIVNIAITQIASGDHAGGEEAFQHVLKFAESLRSRKERRAILSIILERQLQAGEQKYAATTLSSIRQWAETLADPKERADDLESIRRWEAKVDPPQEVLERVITIETDYERQAEMLASLTQRMVGSGESIGRPEVLQKISQKVTALLEKPLPDDSKKAARLLSKLSRVQATVDGAPRALQTAGRIVDLNHRKNTFLGLLSLLIKNRDLAGAKQVLGVLPMKEEDLLSGSKGSTLGDILRELGKFYVEGAGIPEALTWARQQQSHYAKAEALLGVALGVMEQQEIHNLDHAVSTVRSTRTGRIDKLAIGCSML